MKPFINKVIFVILNIFSPNFLKIKFLSEYKESIIPQEEKKNLFNYLKSIYLTYYDKEVFYKEEDPYRRIEIQKLCFGGKDDGLQYSINEYDYGSQRYINGPKFKPILKKIDELYLEHKNRNILVIQIGSSNGRKIQYISKKYTNFNLIGIDIFDSVISYCNKNNKIPNLVFKKKFAHELDEVILEEKYDLCIIFSSGSAQYIQPEHLEIFFKKIKKLNNIFLIFCEGFYSSNTKNIFFKSNKSFFNTSFHFSHKYGEYADDAGLTVEKMEIDDENKSCVFIAKT